MKLGTFLSIIALGAVAYVLLVGLDGTSLGARFPKAPRARSTTARSQAAPAPAAPRHAWRSEDLVFIRGIVQEIRADGSFVVDCNQKPAVWDLSSDRLGPNAANPAALSDKQWKLDAEEFNRYGKVLIMKDGYLQPSDWTPGASAAGIVRVRDVPSIPSCSVGSGLKLIAAPLSRQEFTMNYNAAADPHGAWMQRERAGALDRR